MVAYYITLYYPQNSLVISCPNTRINIYSLCSHKIAIAHHAVPYVGNFCFLVAL